MNSFGSWWDTTITVYNKFTDPQTNIVRWYRHVVHNAFWQNAGSEINIGSVVLKKLIILSVEFERTMLFLEKYLWIKKPNDEMHNYFTLGVGDIIVKGEVDDEIDEYTAGMRSTDLKKKYKDLQGCMEIRIWSNNTGGGRGNEHYFTSGK